MLTVRVGKTHPPEHGVVEFRRGVQRHFSESVTLQGAQHHHGHYCQAVYHLIEVQIGIFGDVTGVGI